MKRSYDLISVLKMTNDFLRSTFHRDELNFIGMRTTKTKYT